MLSEIKELFNQQNNETHINDTNPSLSSDMDEHELLLSANISHEYHHIVESIDNTESSNH